MARRPKHPPPAPVIVEMTDGEALACEAIHSPTPAARVFIAQYTAALAQAECCDVLASRGAIELSCRFEPSPLLCQMFGLARQDVVGALGWALPVVRPKETAPRIGEPVALVQWRTRGCGRIGAMGAN